MSDIKESKSLSSGLSGIAGEYYVAAELSSRGYIASITLRNTKGIDILCSNEDASKSVGIQVKTNRRFSRDWVLNEKGEKYYATNLFYVFVNLNDGKRPPDFFVVPSKIVAKYIKENHEIWSNSLGKHGQAHNNTTMRKFRDKDEKYLSSWGLLGL